MPKPVLDYQKRFQSIFESDLVGIVLSIIEDDRIIHREPNKAFCKMLGYQQEELETNQELWLKIISSESISQTENNIKQLFDKGVLQAGERKLVCKDGSELMVTTSSQLKDNIIASIFIDISEKTKAEEKLKASEASFKTFADFSIVGINFWDVEGRIWGINQAYTDIHGYIEQDLNLSGFNWQNILAPGEEYKFTESIQRTLNGETIKPYETRIQHKNGHIVDILVGYALLPNSKTEGVCVTIDISKQKKMEKALLKSEAKFKWLYNSNAIGIQFWDIEGNIDEANEAFYNILGYSKTEFIEKKLKWTDVALPEEAIMSMGKAKRVIAGETVPPYDIIYRHKNGSLVYALIGIAMLEGSSKDGIAFILDVTQQKKAEEALMQSEEQFRLMTDQSPIMTALSDINGKITYTNKAILQFTGLPSDRLIDENWIKIVHPEDQNRLLTQWGNAIVKRELLLTSFRSKNAKDEYRVINAVITPVFYLNNEFKGFIGVYEDVTDQQIAQKAVEELLEKKDEFLSIASHELKTPLTSLKVSLQLLNELIKSHKYDLLPEYLQKSDKYLNRLVKLINELLDVSKIKSGKMELYYETFYVSELQELCTDFLQANSKKHKLQFIARSNFAIEADKNRIEQALFNLLSNALKYSPDGEIVIVDISQDDNYAYISVQDDGIGIPQEQLNHIFERFYRIEEKYNKTSGLGLGLYITHEIIKKHQGEIIVKSQFGKGSLFTIKIPLQKQLSAEVYK